ncbi:hypothetical protein B0T17DRAFT_482016 [Bombardia bombarda]|uniref:Uncharacterized protein n=1 Tax=Bombardia bombarda TaxID=252184 RepID=A0AA40CGJ7_9PEZI|nr:hypothetical protein B0T17DRAFT_482016 [Bombardia bombarda]
MQSPPSRSSDSTFSSTGNDGRTPINPLSSLDEFIAPCPNFRILVLGNAESTKQEIFSHVFGVDLEKKLLADAFDTAHAVPQPLDLHSQNGGLTVYTSANFGTGDESAYARACDFIGSSFQEEAGDNDRIHCIWYCVAADESRDVHPLEARFFANLASIAPHVPVVLLFTKYDDFVAQVQVDWAHTAQQRGQSKVAVAHILRGLAAKQFEKTVGRKWDDAFLSALGGRSRAQQIPRVCVASGAEEELDEDDEEVGNGPCEHSSFDRLVASTMGILRDASVKLAFAAAQRDSASVSTHFCADVAADYFTVDTGHARKADGVDMRDIVPNFWAKAVRIFNMRDVGSVLTDSKLLGRVLHAAFLDTSQQPIMTECLSHSGTEPTLFLGLSPHERAVLLAQVLGEIVLFLHKLADTQWPHGGSGGPTALAPPSLTSRTVERVLAEFREGQAKTEVLDIVEASRIFSSCQLRQGVSDLITKAVEQADRVVSLAPPKPAVMNNRAVVVVDDDAGDGMRDISLSFVNDKGVGPDDMVLPCGLRILPLN